MRFEDRAALEREHDELRRGRAFISGTTGLEVFTPCELVLHHPDGGEPLSLGATVVMPPDVQATQNGVGLELDDGATDAIDAFVSRKPASPPRESLQHRIQTMSITEQIKLARSSGSLQERTLLERMLGKTVWETLLRNPRITVPEVATIARKGTVPRPLLEQIVDNAAWASAPTVRRALLANRKLTRESVLKVLRLTPRHELQLMARQTAYSPAVRLAARRLLGGE